LSIYSLILTDWESETLTANVSAVKASHEIATSPATAWTPRNDSKIFA